MALVNSFNCRLCLQDNSPKELPEDPINIKIIELNISLVKLVDVNVQCPSIEQSEALLIEDVEDEIHQNGVEEEVVHDQDVSDCTNNSDSAKDCCIWNKCSKCDTIQRENNSLNETIKGNLKRIEELQSEPEKESEALQVKENEFDTKNKTLQDTLIEKVERLNESGRNYNDMKSKLIELEVANKRYVC